MFKLQKLDIFGYFLRFLIHKPKREQAKFKIEFNLNILVIIVGEMTE